jgi:hypothetical protein
LSNAKSGLDREAAPGFRCTQSGLLVAAKTFAISAFEPANVAR